jgi:hypothetical protein
MTFLLDTIKKLILLVLSVFTLFTTAYSQALVRANNCLDFDGNNDIVEILVDSTLDVRSQKSFTVEAWVNTTYFSGDPYGGTILAWYDVPGNKGYNLAVGGNGQAYFGIHNDTVDAELTSASNRLSTSKWHHLAATYDGSKLKLYIDGSLRDSLADTIVVGQPISTPFTIGALSSGLNSWNGKIDELRVWNYSRTAAQILANYNQRVCGFDASLRASFTFNQGKSSGSNGTIKKLTDYSGYGHDGTLKNFTLNGTSSNWVNGYLINSTVISVVDTVVRCDRYGAPSKRTTFTNSGIYYDTIYSVRGCDSAIKIILTIKKSSSKSIKVRTCKSYTVPSGLKTYTSSGVYTDILPNSVGCDSVITINLRVGPDSTWTKISVCDFFVTPFAKRIYDKSGIYRDTLKNYFGCDSIIFYDVQVLKSTLNKISMTFCRSISLPTNGQVITTPGVYYDTLLNSVGCDSVIEYQLFSKQTLSNFNDFACGSYLSATGKVYTKTGFYQDTLVNYKGCDSIINLNLTVIPTTYGSVNLNGCRKVRSLSRKYWYYRSGQYIDTIMNTEGCDSIVTQNVTITQLIDTVFTSNDTLFASFDPLYQYQWFECSNGLKPILGANQSYYVPLNGGSYSCRVIQGGCSDTTACIQFQKSSTHEISAFKVSVYPNPTNGVVFLRSHSHLVAPVSWRLLGMDGRFLSSGDVSSAIRQSEYKLDLSEFKGNLDCVRYSNWYVLEVRLSNGSSLFYKICIE